MKYALLFALYALGCVTPYQPKSFTGGYTEEPVGNGIVAVSFKGNGFTSGSTVMTYAMRRASEYCTEQGKSGYEVVNSNADRQNYQTAGQTTCQSNGYLNDGYYNGSTNCSNSPGWNVTKHTVTLYIRCVSDTAH